MYLSIIPFSQCTSSIISTIALVVDIGRRDFCYIKCFRTNLPFVSCPNQFSHQYIIAATSCTCIILIRFFKSITMFFLKRTLFFSINSFYICNFSRRIYKPINSYYQTLLKCQGPYILINLKILSIPMRAKSNKSTQASSAVAYDRI